MWLALNETKKWVSGIILDALGTTEGCRNQTCGFCELLRQKGLGWEWLDEQSRLTIRADKRSGQSVGVSGEL